MVTETWQSEIVATLAKFLRLQVVDATPSTLRDTAVDPARVGRARRSTDVQVFLRDLSIRSDHDVDIGALLADQTGAAVDEHGDAVVPRVPVASVGTLNVHEATCGWEASRSPAATGLPSDFQGLSLGSL